MQASVITGSNAGRHGSIDIWSLGCVVLEMATGRRPWANLDNEWAIMWNIAAGHPPQLPTSDQLSEQGIDFLKRCFERDPGVRSSAAELLQHPWVFTSTLHEDISLRRRFKKKKLIFPSYRLSTFAVRSSSQQHRHPNPLLQPSARDNTILKHVLKTNITCGFKLAYGALCNKVIPRRRSIGFFIPCMLWIECLGFDFLGLGQPYTCHKSPFVIYGVFSCAQCTFAIVVFIQGLLTIYPSLFDALKHHRYLPP